MRKLVVAAVVILLGGAAGGYWWWQGHRVTPAIVSSEMKGVQDAARNFPQNTGVFGVWHSDPAEFTLEERLNIISAVHQFVKQVPSAKSDAQNSLSHIVAMLTDPKIMTPDVVRDLLPQTSALGIYPTTPDTIGDMFVTWVAASQKPDFNTLPLQFYSVVTVVDGARAGSSLATVLQKITAAYPGTSLSDAQYRDRTLHILKFPETEFALAWTIEKNTILSGTQASVQNALDRMISPDAGLAGNALFNQALSELHGQGATFFVDLRLKVGDWVEKFPKEARGLVSEILPVWSYWAGVFPMHADVVGETVVRISDQATRGLRRNVLNPKYNIVLGAASVIPQHMDYFVSFNWKMLNGLVDLILGQTKGLAVEEQRKKFGLDQKNLETIFDGEIAVGFVYPDLSKSMSMVDGKMTMSSRLPQFEVALAAKVRDADAFHRQISQWMKLEETTWSKQDVEGTVVYQSPFCSYARLGDYVVIVPKLQLLAAAGVQKESQMVSLVQAHAHGETLAKLAGFGQAEQKLGNVPAVGQAFISSNYYKKYFDSMTKIPGMDNFTKQLMTTGKMWWLSDHLNNVVIDESGMRTRYVRSNGQ